jgi:multidrug efflux system membrane fusion protein
VNRLLLSALGVAALAGCAKKQAPPPPVIPVKVASVEQRDVPVEIDATGSIEPVKRVSVASQVPGLIQRVAFREGQDVRQGQLLFQVEPSPFRAALKQAQAMLARDRVQAANAQRDAERYAALAQKEYVTAQQTEAQRANAAALAATVQADEAAVESAQINLENASIRAPIAGRAGTIALREGNLVRNDGSPLTTINQVHPILVRFAVPARHLGDLQRRPMGDVTVEVATPGDSVQVGHLAFINNTIDTATGTVLLKGQFPNTDGRLWPGGYVNVRVRPYVQQNALVVPAVAVTTGQQGSTVFVVQQGKAESRPVKVDRVVGELAVIATGLRPGEQVVTEGQIKLTPGARVEIRGGVPSPQEAAATGQEAP